MNQFRRQSSLPNEQDFLVEVGRSSEGTFLQVTHVPTGRRSRKVPSIGQHQAQTGQTYEELALSLVAELIESRNVASSGREPVGDKS